jgi:hypothetical protein
MILTFAGVIRSRVGQPRAGDRHLNVTISASQVAVPVAVKGVFGVIPRRTPLTSPDTLDRPSGHATGRTGMRPATSHNKGSLAQVTVTADWRVVNRFRISTYGWRGGAGVTLFHHRACCVIVLGSL